MEKTLDKILREVKVEDYPEGKKIGDSEDRHLEEFVRDQYKRAGEAMKALSDQWFD